MNKIDCNKIHLSTIMMNTLNLNGQGGGKREDALYLADSGGNLIVSADNQLFTLMKG